jgi:hypothetical protein
VVVYADSADLPVPPPANSRAVAASGLQVDSDDEHATIAPER